jgi:putative membrane protein
MLFIESRILKISLYFFLFLSKKKTMKLILRLIITAFLVVVISYLLKGIVVDSFLAALKVAIVLTLLNFVVKPVLVLLTLPVTILTLGLFLLVINAVIILVCDNLVDGFHVANFWMALFFSIILSVSQSLVFQLSGENK